MCHQRAGSAPAQCAAPEPDIHGRTHYRIKDSEPSCGGAATECFHATPDRSIDPIDTVAVKGL